MTNVIDFYEALARSHGYKSWAELEQAFDAAEDARMEAESRAYGFESFEAYAKAMCGAVEKE